MSLRGVPTSWGTPRQSRTEYKIARRRLLRLPTPSGGTRNDRIQRVIKKEAQNGTTINRQSSYGNRREAGAGEIDIAGHGRGRRRPGNMRPHHGRRQAGGDRQGNRSHGA